MLENVCLQYVSDFDVTSIAHLDNLGLVLSEGMAVGESPKRNFVYIVRCKDGSLYTGWTTDVAHRVEQHNLGRGAKYTRARGPVELVFVEEFDTKVEAQKREYAIKRLTRVQKVNLINGNPTKSGPVK